MSERLPRFKLGPTPHEWRLRFAPREYISHAARAEYGPLEELDGLCEIRKKRLMVASELTGRKMFDAVIHEALHAALPDLDEEAIARVAYQLSYVVDHVVRTRCE